jgi:hypothetical protein
LCRTLLNKINERDFIMELKGFATDWRNNVLEKTAAGVIAIVAAGALLSGCESQPDDPGVVMTGADGQNYVLPEGAERPIYNTLQDCLDDVRARIKAIESDGGDKIEETAEDLCQQTDTYAHSGGVVTMSRWYGPIIRSGGRWESPKVTSWEPVTDRTFAAPGLKVQRGVTIAPAGSFSGQRVTIRGGFGGTGKGVGKGGFARGAGS